MANAAEVAKKVARVPDEVVQGFTSIDDAIRYFNSNEGVVQAGDVLGDGFTITEKEALLNIPLLILDWSEHLGDSGPYASVRAITSDNRKVRFSDGSTGIYRQLTELFLKGVERGILVRTGLTKSDYFVNEKTGEITKTNPGDPKVWKKATTYYLATS